MKIRDRDSWFQRWAFIFVGTFCFESHLPASLVDDFVVIEETLGGRLGVYAVDLGTNQSIGFRENERFLLCSTFKVPLVAALLYKVGHGEELLERRIAFGAEDLVSHAPVTSERVAEGSLTIEDLCKAALGHSDNTAANLLLKVMSGPATLNEFFRFIGDRYTRLDRYEPELNCSLPGEIDDTTTPMAIAKTLRTIFFESVLTSGSKQMLKDWLLQSVTGEFRLKSSVPPGWQVVAKSGTGEEAVNDVGILCPPDGFPVLISIYIAGSQRPLRETESHLSNVSKLILEEFDRVPRTQ